MGNRIKGELTLQCPSQEIKCAHLLLIEMNTSLQATESNSKASPRASQPLRKLAFINPRLTTRNVGDFFIEDSVKRILQYDVEASVDIDPRRPLDSDAIGRINGCDAAVIVGTNLWYRQMRKDGRWMITLDELKKIRVPIIPFGVGTTRHRDEDNGFDVESLEMLRRIHGSCEKASVRDLRTLEALSEAGIKNVSMTGCPTLFRSLQPAWVLNSTKPSRELVVTVRKGQKQNVWLLLKHLRARQWDTLVAAQQDPDMYFSRGFPLLRPGARTLYEYSIQPYLDCVKRCFGAIGWRLHGNMLHLAHGNPAIFFANCSRTESFCQSFALPCVTAEDRESIPKETIVEAIERLEEPSTFSKFPERYGYYRREMADFLDGNGLAHRLKDQA